jgi:hypothetical protein
MTEFNQRSEITLCPFMDEELCGFLWRDTVPERSQCGINGRRTGFVHANTENLGWI